VWPTHAEKLLLRAALLHDERALAAWHELRPQIDLATLDGASIAAIPTLRRNLVSLGIDDELFMVFKGVHRYNWARNQFLLNGVLPVVAELERSGIPTLLLKGAALVAATEADAGVRQMADIDVLVPTNQADAAIEVLGGVGLTPLFETPPWYVSQYAPQYVPSFPFAGADGRELDLHWHVLHASCQVNADDDFWRAAIPVELRGVRTLALCPTDALLHAILHGFEWSDAPTVRWALDAAMIIAGSAGPIDYERLVVQARLRRVTAILRKGLEFLRAVADAPVPAEAVSALRSRRPLIAERLELRARLAWPGRLTALQRAVAYQQQCVRRQIPLGEPAGLLRQLRVARECFGVERFRDAPALLREGAPGPGRPLSRTAAALGTGAEAPGVEIELGAPLELGEPEWARSAVRYGVWLPEPGGGAWLAGRESRIALRFRDAPQGSLLLAVSGEHYLHKWISRARLGVHANGHRVGWLSVDAGRSSLDSVALRLPPEALTGRSDLDLTFYTPDAASPARLGIAGDDRQLGFFMRRLEVRAPLRCKPGDQLDCRRSGAGALLAGWSAPEPSGRWSDGELAEILLVIDGSAPFELTLEADPYIGRPGRRLAVRVEAGGERIATLSYDESDVGGAAVRRIPVAASHVDPRGELLLSLRIRTPTSPFELGLGDDRRRLGLCLRRLVLSEL
jgi:hypothetical protein